MIVSALLVEGVALQAAAKEFALFVECLGRLGTGEELAAAEPPERIDQLLS